MKRLLLLLAIIPLCGMVKLTVVRITWTAPTEYADGTPLIPHHYNLYLKQGAATTWEPPFSIPDNRTIWNTYGKLFDKQVWAVTAVDAAGNESEKSNSLTFYH